MAQQRTQLELVQALNHDFQGRTAANPEMEGLIQSFELAFRMQTEAPKFFDLSDEPQSVLKMYGADKEPTAEYARQCILARRFAEAGVRFIQVNKSGWDHHGSIDKGLPKSCAEVDQPITTLLSDLKMRGMLQDTLVLSAANSAALLPPRAKARKPAATTTPMPSPSGWLAAASAAA